MCDKIYNTVFQVILLYIQICKFNLYYGRYIYSCNCLYMYLFYLWFNIDAGFQFNIVISVIARVINMHIVSLSVICLWYAHRFFSAGYNFQKTQLGNTSYNFVCVCSNPTELMPLFSLVFVSCTDICIEIHIDIVLSRFPQIKHFY